MTLLFKRKILATGDSLAVSLPKEVVSTHKLKKGAEVYVISDAMDEDGFLVIDLMGRTREEIWRLLKE